MPLTQIQPGSYEAASINTTDLGANVTATYATYAAVAANLTPRITTVNVANSSYTVLDDTSVNTSGGYLVITGANFQSGAIVTVQDTNATSTTYVNDTTLRAQVPAKTAGSYNLYVTNPDGGTAIRVNGVTFSNTPIWSTAAALSNQAANTAFAVNISATSDSNVTYSNTTSLPAGTTLLANGLFYGTVTIGAETVYTFTVNAVDAELQDTPREFSLTVTVGPPAQTLWSVGDGTIGGRGTSVSTSSPVQVGSNNNWNLTSISYALAGAIKSDGTLWTWGNSAAGKLGIDNNASNLRSPTQVGSATNWKFIQMSWYRALAVKTNGTLWAWGAGNGGALGLNNAENKSSPTQVGSGSNWSMVSIGGGGITAGTTAAAIKSDGTLWLWGAAGYGQLGINNRTYRSSPVQVGTDTNWQWVATSFGEVYAIKTNGTLWAWGKNDNGLLGLNDAIGRSSPVQVGSGTDWNFVVNRTSAGSEAGFLAVKTNGTLWTCGYGFYGDLGNNQIINVSSPIQIGTSTNWQTVNFSGGIPNRIPISFGINTAAALKTDGTLWRWGRQNNYGDLGLNDLSNRSSPTQVGSSTNWYNLSVGAYVGSLFTRT